MKEKRTPRRRSQAQHKGNDTAKKKENQVWKVFKTISFWIWRLRGIWISIPVLLVAIQQALVNNSRLPDEVGILLKSSGEYFWTVSRSTAVMAPILVTIGCLVLTCLSKRTLFPWLISVFTLILPMLIWLTNIYPA